MARTKVVKEAAQHIPSIEITRTGDKKIEHQGKNVLIIDGSWQYAFNTNNEIKKYLSNPGAPENNGIDQNGKSFKEIVFEKSSYDFVGVMDYSLDLKHLLDYCEQGRKTKDYFKTYKSKNYCLAFVKVSFTPGTKDVREFLYRPDGFKISYDIKDKESKTIQYVRYKRTASGAREGSCLFIAKELYDEMMLWSSAGIDSDTAKSIDAVSWEAYVALTLSSIEKTFEINPRQILFVEDKEIPVQQGKAFEVTNDSYGNLTVNNVDYSNSEKSPKNDNKIWDGEGLIDDSLFTENIVLSDHYSDKCMLLLRGKFFKACVFRTHIQKWFSDNGITDVKELNGYTKATRINEIKFIIPYSCLKFLKFKGNKEEKEVIKDWITSIASANKTPVFGIIKSDKASKLMNGEKVFTTYQMLNTLGFDEGTAEKFLEETKSTMLNLTEPGKKGAKYVKRYIDNIYFTPSNDQDEYGEESTSINDTFKVFHHKELTASKLLDYDFEYYKTEHYKEVVKSLLDHIKKQVTHGRVMIDGVYAYLFCNGIELLKHSIDNAFNPDLNSKNNVTVNSKTYPLLNNTEIYSKRFDCNSKLLCARNPHITMGNYYLATNKHYNIYDKYFVLSNEIVCVNAINSDIMNTLNGCDFDSDTMLITNNSIMVDLLKQTLRKNKKTNKFRTPFNSIKSESKKPNGRKESIFLSDIDDTLSNNKIGEIVNLSQRLNSLVWMLSPLKKQNETNWNNFFADIGKLYKEGCCALAILSNIEIDSAKRSYQCNTKEEIKKIEKLMSNKDYVKLKEYTSWLNNKSNYQTPIFNDKEELWGHPILGLDPMGYIIKVITNTEKEALKNISKHTVENYVFFEGLFNNYGIIDKGSKCEESLNRCLDVLTKCYKHLTPKDKGSNKNIKYKPKKDYTKDCLLISNCFNTVNQTLNKGTVPSNDLLWRLIKIMDDSSRIITTGPETDKTYFIVTEKEYEQAAEEDRLKRPEQLLWGALFVSMSDEETYLIKHIDGQKNPPE